jgi:hypothetical protein
MDGRSRPYFFGLDQTLNFQQKEALAQGIQQVIETTPAGFESFEFQFSNYSVYIYKLDQGTILLVLTNENLQPSGYRDAIQQLKLSLQDDITKAVATFRLLAGSISLSGQNYWGKSANGDGAGTTTGKTSQSSRSSRSAAESTTAPTSNSTNSTSSTGRQTNTGRQTAPTPGEPNLSEVLSALNHLSQFACQYLGKAVVTNYWKSSRPDLDWLNIFQVERTSKVSLDADAGASPQATVTAEQQQWVKTWVAAFIARCAKVIRDFPVLVEQQALSDRERQILLFNPKSPAD